MRAPAKMCLEAAGGRGVLVPLPLPGRFGQFLRAGLALVREKPAGKISFQEWQDRAVYRGA